MQLRLLLRLIFRNAEIYALKIVTLAVAFTALVLVSVFSIHEFRYDRFHDNAKDVFRIVKTKSTETYGRNKQTSQVTDLVYEQLTEQSAYTLARTKVLNELNVIVNDRLLSNQQLHVADQQITDIFTFNFIDGGAEIFKKYNQSIILSSKLAEQYFNTLNITGKRLQIYTYSDTLSYEIAGVYEAFPLNSHQAFDAFLLYNDSNLLSLGFDPITFEVYGRKKPTVNVSESNSLLETAESRYTKQPIGNIYFGPRISGEDVAHGDLYSVIILLSITSLILFLAVTSFINLTSLGLPKRVKELAIKKLSGHTKLRLTLSFIGESFFISCTALILSGLLIWLSQEFIRSIQVLELTPLVIVYQIWLIPIVLIFLIVLSVTPLVMIKKFIKANATRLLSTEAITFPRFKQIIIVLQLGISILLIVSAIVINRQITYSLVKEPGRNNYQVVYLNYPSGMTDHQLRRLKNGWKKSKPNIVNVMATSQLPNNIMSRDLETGLYTLSVDAEFNEFFDLKLIKGGWFGANDGDSIILLNERAHLLSKSEAKNVRGVFQGLSNQFNRPEKPLQIVRGSNLNHNFLFIRILEVDILKTIGFLENYFQNNEKKASIKFLDKRFESWLTYQIRLNAFTNMLTIIAALLSCFAIYGLSINVVRDKLKQIAIRKICGASVSHVIFLLVKEFSRNLIIAVLLFAPVTYILLKELLRLFVYSTSLHWFDPLYPLIYCGGIILVLCTWQAIKLNNSDLADVLKE